ncbi:Phosphate-regulating neutral endopeptidase [Aphelenchoides fujianensis]|nr:Phosphate-regulating neutral endopeptidase [Aphelenchoides fujianensis]
MLEGAGWAAASYKLDTLVREMNKRAGINFLFDLELSLPTRGGQFLLVKPADLIIASPEWYTDGRFADKVDALKDFLAQLMLVLGADLKSAEPVNAIKTAVDEVVELEKQLAAEFVKEKINDETTLEKTLKDPKKLSDLKALMPDFDWDTNLKENVLLADPKIQTLLAGDPKLFIHTPALITAIRPILAADDRKTANWLMIRYVLKQLPYLDSRFVAIGNEFAEKLDGSKHRSTRDQDCFDEIRRSFPLVVDHLYVRQFVSNRSQLGATRVMDKLREGFAGVLRGEKWMDESTKAYAIRKLGQMKEVVAAVDVAKKRKLLDERYKGLSLSSADKFAQMATKVRIAKGQLKYAVLVQSGLSLYDPSRAAGSTSPVHLYEENKLFIPGSVLQAPFFDLALPASVTYGALGFLIGQAMGHGFDKKGGKYDANGLKRTWWSKQTKKQFKAERQCLVNAYGQHVDSTTGQRVDGQRTLKENAADAAGIRAAFAAYRAYANGAQLAHVPGYAKYTADQTFFLGFSTASSFLSLYCLLRCLQMMCASLDPKYAADLHASDPHAPSEFRVDVVLQNMPEFAAAFNCRAGTKMNPKSKCSPW